MWLQYGKPCFPHPMRTKILIFLPSMVITSMSSMPTNPQSTGAPIASNKHHYPPGLEPSTNETNTDNTATFLYDLSQAVFHDTTQIPTQGYAVLCFRAENLRVWLFHCHVL